MFAEISGFLFLFIIVVLIAATSRYDYEIFSELDSAAMLQEISEDPKKFRIGTMLVLVEHVIIITLAVSLFIAFNQYNLLLGVIWVCARSIEGLIQIYRKRDYWDLLNIANLYSGAHSGEKDALNDSALAILKSKNSAFSISQILFSIGTLAYSIMFVISGVIPEIIGWFGIAAGIIYGVGNCIFLIRPNNKALWNLGGLLIWIFELVLGGWLLFSALIPFQHE
ncbi:MAG: DUF4386 domain-containing protein [Candidatus Thorarchaeota archaeon]